MAGALKIRDADGTVRTVEAVKVRDIDGTLRTLSFIRIRDADGTLREVFVAGGGGGGAANPAYVNPGSRSTYAHFPSNTAYFTAASTGTAPSAFAWGVIEGDGLIVSGATAATAQLRVIAHEQEETASATFYCDMTIDGVVYRATCVMNHTYLP